jgi:hypothetical protein
MMTKRQTPLWEDATFQIARQRNPCSGRIVWNVTATPPAYSAISVVRTRRWYVPGYGSFLAEGDATSACQLDGLKYALIDVVVIVFLIEEIDGS